MAKKQSIQSRYMVVFTLTVVIISIALLYGLRPLRTELLRNEARAVADQVISFRAWVAQSGMVWVDKLSPDFHDFLVKRYDSTSGGSYYGKNPALATRELSTIANKTATRATFRVTSDEYRHESNKPDNFEQKAIKTFKADSKSLFAEDYEHDYYRYAMPILVKKGCLKCHGDPEDAPQAVIEKYGDKKAFGYKVGDVRGIISVKIPALGLIDVIKTMANPLTIGLVIIAFIFNFLFTSRVIINRLRRLTKDAEAIAGGQLTTELNYKKPKESNDEVDHAYHAVNLLRQSLRIMIKNYKKKR